MNKLCMVSSGRVLSFNDRSENRLENMTKIAIGPVGGNADSTKYFCRDSGVIQYLERSVT